MSQPPSDTPGNPPGQAFTPQDAMEFLQKIWNPFGVPVPGFGLPGAGAMPAAAPAVPPAAAAPVAPAGMPFAGMAFPNPATMFATLDPAEVERKIGELRVIENWLQMSLNLMQMSIKTLELQKASLEALRGTQAPAPAAKPESTRR
jgi:hypothetical protein